MSADDPDHAGFVGAWLSQAGESLSPPELVALFERALRAMWQRSELTLGEVTLTAIVDRVVCSAVESHPFLAALRIDKCGVCFDDFREEVVYQPGLREAVRFVLVEFLTVLGRLTDEIMTPALHAALSSVRLEPRADDNHACRGAKP